MALKIDKILGNGVTGNHWVVAEMTINPIAQVSKVVLYLYLNKAAKQAGLQPAFVKTIDLNGAAFPFTDAAMNAKNAIKLAYDAIKSDPDLVGSIDD
jgi:hypothetical protein